MWETCAILFPSLSPPFFRQYTLDIGIQGFMPLLVPSDVFSTRDHFRRISMPASTRNPSDKHLLYPAYGLGSSKFCDSDAALSPVRIGER
jgi:hypothetical protein